jgi:hypothetical protein
VPFLPSLMVASGILLRPHVQGASGRALLIGVAALALVQFVTAPALLYSDFPDRRGTLSALLTPNAPRYNHDLPRQLGAARQAMQAAAPPSALFVGSNLILAAETGRSVPAKLRMGPFAHTNEMTADRADRLHLITSAELEELYSNGDTRAVALFPGRDLNFGWSLPSFTLTSEAQRERWSALLRRNFRVVYAEGQFVVLARPPAMATPSPP